MKKISAILYCLERRDGYAAVTEYNLTRIAEKLDEVIDAINSMPRFTIIQDTEEEED